MAKLELVVTAEQSGRTVRALLKAAGLSTARLNRLKRTETGLTVNGGRVFTSAVLQAGDQLTVDLDAAERATEAEPIPMDLDIPYEDGHLLALNKSAPLAVIPSSLAPKEHTLANGLAHYLGPGSSFHPVNRLDRGTTGLMVVAKNGFIHDRLRRQLHSGAFCRKYLALCLGTPRQDTGCITLPIGRAPGSAIKRQAGAEGGQSAWTDYRVLWTGGSPEKLSLVELTPRTGRTHQLRVHMAALGCPLAGDWLYGQEDRETIVRPALHAAYLELVHPVSGERLALNVPPPEDMARLLEWAGYHPPSEKMPTGR